MNNSEKLIIGNWKMNKTPSEAKATTLDLISILKTKSKKHRIMIAPAYICLPTVANIIANNDTILKLVAQDVSCYPHGAYTGEVSISMLKDVGVDAVIIGHSERRQYHTETNEQINQKLHLVLGANLTGIVCVGETLQQRENNQAFSVIREQLEGALRGILADSLTKIVIAYEPVWAIGTGKTASSSQAEEIHSLIREALTKLYNKNSAESVVIQYGGSVKPDNVRELMGMPNIDGALVGGASLDAHIFASLIDF